MTIEKIKYTINPEVFNYWTSNVPSQVDINNAFFSLKKEIEQGLLVGVEYYAELELLRSRIA